MSNQYQLVLELLSLAIFGFFAGLFGWYCRGAHQRELEHRARTVRPNITTKNAGQRFEDGMREIVARVGHIYWQAGEPDCPDEVKADNGEVFKLRCKKCGQDNPPSKWCAVSELPAMAARPGARHE